MADTRKDILIQQYRELARVLKQLQFTLDYPVSDGLQWLNRDQEIEDLLEEGLAIIGKVRELAALPA